MPLQALQDVRGEPAGSGHSDAANSPVTVRAAPQGEGVTFWEVSSRRRVAVDTEITKIQCDGAVVRSDFYRPWREFPDGRQQWRATGYTIAAEVAHA